MSEKVKMIRCFQCKEWIHQTCEKAITCRAFTESDVCLARQVFEKNYMARINGRVNVYYLIALYMLTYISRWQHAAVFGICSETVYTSVHMYVWR